MNRLMATLSKRTESIGDLAPDRVFLMDHKAETMRRFLRSALRGQGARLLEEAYSKIGEKNHRNYHPQSLFEVMLSPGAIAEDGRSQGAQIPSAVSEEGACSLIAAEPREPPYSTSQYKSCMRYVWSLPPDILKHRLSELYRFLQERFCVLCPAQSTVAHLTRRTRQRRALRRRGAMAVCGPVRGRWSQV